MPSTNTNTNETATWCIAAIRVLSKLEREKSAAKGKVFSSKGVHSLYSGFADAYSEHFGRPFYSKVLGAQDAAFLDVCAAGHIVTQRVRQGMMVYVAGEEPNRAESREARGKALDAEISAALASAKAKVKAS